MEAVLYFETASTRLHGVTARHDSLHSHRRQTLKSVIAIFFRRAVVLEAAKSSIPAALYMQGALLQYEALKRHR